MARRRIRGVNVYERKDLKRFKPVEPMKLFLYVAAIASSLLMGVILLYSLGSNFSNFASGVSDQFIGSSDYAVFLNTMTFVILAGLAGVISYRGKAFNVGIAGQILMSGFIGYIFAYLMPNMDAKGFEKIFSIFIPVIIGMSLGWFTSFLKIKFGINEVLSGVLLNWFIYFMFLYLAQAEGAAWANYTNDIYGGLNPIENDNFVLTMNNGVSIMLIFAIVAVIIMGFLYARSRWGMRQEIVSEGPRFAKYAGVDYNGEQRRNFVIGGMFAGLAGATLFFNTTPPSVTTSTDVVDLIVTMNIGIISMLISVANPVALLVTAPAIALLLNVGLTPFEGLSAGITSISPALVKPGIDVENLAATTMLFTMGGVIGVTNLLTNPSKDIPVDKESEDIAYDYLIHFSEGKFNPEVGISPFQQEQIEEFTLQLESEKANFAKIDPSLTGVERKLAIYDAQDEISWRRFYKQILAREQEENERFKKYVSEWQKEMNVKIDEAFFKLIIGAVTKIGLDKMKQHISDDDLSLLPTQERILESKLLEVDIEESREIRSLIKKYNVKGKEHKFSEFLTKYNTARKVAKDKRTEVKQTFATFYNTEELELNRILEKHEAEDELSFNNYMAKIREEEKAENDAWLKTRDELTKEYAVRITKLNETLAKISREEQEEWAKYIANINAEQHKVKVQEAAIKASEEAAKAKRTVNDIYGNRVLTPEEFKQREQAAATLAKYEKEDEVQWQKYIDNLKKTNPRKVYGKVLTIDEIRKHDEIEEKLRKYSLEDEVAFVKFMSEYRKEYLTKAEYKAKLIEEAQLIEAAEVEKREKEKKSELDLRRMGKFKIVIPDNKPLRTNDIQTLISAALDKTIGNVSNSSVSRDEESIEKIIERAIQIATTRVLENSNNTKMSSETLKSQIEHAIMVALQNQQAASHANGTKTNTEEVLEKVIDKMLLNQAHMTGHMGGNSGTPIMMPQMQMPSAPAPVQSEPVSRSSSPKSAPAKKAAKRTPIVKKINTNVFKNIASGKPTVESKIDVKGGKK